LFKYNLKPGYKHISYLGNTSVVIWNIWKGNPKHMPPIIMLQRVSYHTSYR